VVWPLDRFHRLDKPDTFSNPALQVTGAVR
jgi:hypothetical protein